MKKALVVILISMLIGCSKKEAQQVSQDDQFLDNVSSFFFDMHGFTENVKAREVLVEYGINLRELSYKKGNCEYVITFSLKKNMLKRGGELRAANESELLNCLLNNSDIASKMFVPLTVAPPKISEKALLNLITEMRDMLKREEKDTKVVKGGDALDFIITGSSKNIIWLYEVPMIYK